MNPTPVYQNSRAGQAGSILYLTHGGGPWPLLGEPRHKELISFLGTVPQHLIAPKTIVVISAHWEEQQVAVTGNKRPEMYFDYYGFPEESYAISYPAPGDPQLAEEICKLLHTRGLTATIDEERGYDHGCFVPLMLMYPKATIPCIQVSLLADLNPENHLRLGEALGGLRREGLLFVGSGSSFHNLRAFREPPQGPTRKSNEAFDAWLATTLSDTHLSEEERRQRLVHWDEAPAARACHPREEHLLPLHVCYGIAKAPAIRCYSMEMMEKRVSAYLW
jgi:4,5-DOPA dioxygenase extradiol